MDLSVKADEFDSAKNLYGKIFGKEYADMFFDCMANLSNTFVIKENNDVVSIAFAIDKTFICGKEKLEAVYICGVATKEEYRGRHYSEALISFIETKYKSLGYDFAYLVPASESLFDMYAKYGYKTEFYLAEKDYDISAFALNPDKERWCMADKRYIDYFKDFDLYQIRNENDWQFIEREFDERILNYSSDGYVIYHTDKNQIVIRESTLKTEALLKGAVTFIAKKTGANHAKVFLPAKENTNNIPYAMVKCFSNKAERSFVNSKTKYTNANFE